MGSWIISWNFNKQSYIPGESALVSFWLENKGDTALFLSELMLYFDFGSYNIVSIRGEVLPRENKFLGNVSLLLPNYVGKKIFKVVYRIYEYINNNWVDVGCYGFDYQYFINMYPMPFYKVFISRGINIEDMTIGNPIAEIIKEWGFETITVGIEIKVTDDQVLQKIKEEISRSDALIAIATPRYMDTLTGFWKTLEWLHGEVGIAFGIDKPLLILKDKGVSLGGLPSYIAEMKQAPIIEFDPYNIDELRINLSIIMPGFRGLIKDKKAQEFWDAFGKILIGGSAIYGGIKIINGIAGSLEGSSN